MTSGGLWFLPKGTTHRETGIGERPRRHAILFDLKNTVPAFVASSTTHAIGPALGDALPTVSTSAIAPDGKRFLFLRQRATGGGMVRPTVILVRNWFADLAAQLKR